MKRNKPSIDNLIRETNEVRLKKATFEATSEVLLERARMVAQIVEQRARQLTAGETRPDAHR
jgi:hypothetical protein